MLEGVGTQLKGRLFFPICPPFASLCVFLQEVHLKDQNDVERFSREWVQGESRWSVGGVHSTGVGVQCGNRDLKIV